MPAFSTRCLGCGQAVSPLHLRSRPGVPDGALGDSRSFSTGWLFPPALCHSQRFSAQGNSRLRGFSSLLHKVLLCLLQLPKLSARKGRKKKGVFWGIEVAETLRWRGWELGKETIKHLILKNVQEKTQKLSYRCVAGFLLLLLLRLSLHLHPPCSSSHFNTFSQMPLPGFPWAMCCGLAWPDRNVLIQIHSPRSWQEYFKRNAFLKFCFADTSVCEAFPV